MLYEEFVSVCKTYLKLEEGEFEEIVGYEGEKLKNYKGAVIISGAGMEFLPCESKDLYSDRYMILTLT